MKTSFPITHTKGFLFIAIIAVILIICTIYLVLDRDDLNITAGVALNQPMSLFTFRLGSISSNTSLVSTNSSTHTSIDEMREESDIETLRSAITAPTSSQTKSAKETEEIPPQDQSKALFSDITAIVTDANRYLYLADNGAATITKTDSKGNVVARWGGFGTKEGEFKNIADIAIDIYGYIYVADAGNLRVQKFDPYGRFITMWGERGSGKGQFMSMSGIAAQYNTDAKGTLIFVTDSAAAKVLIFSADGEYVSSWGEYGSIAPVEIDHNTVTGVMDRMSLSGSYVSVVSTKNADPPVAERNIAVTFKGKEHNIQIDVDRGAYLGAKYNTPAIGTDTFPEPELWSEYYFKMYSDPVNDHIFDAIITSLQLIQKRERLSVRETIELAIAFVQQISLSKGTTVKYPIEVIHDKTGNSFDKALLLYGILDRFGVNAVYLYFPKNEEAAIGVGKNSLTPSAALTEFGPTNEYRYVFVDVTKPTAIGRMPSTLKNDDPFLLRQNWDNIDELIGYDFNNADEVLYTHEYLKNRLDYISKAKNTKELKNKLNWKEMEDKISEVLKIIEENPLDHDKIITRIRNSKITEMRIKIN